MTLEASCAEFSNADISAQRDQLVMELEPVTNCHFCSFYR
jgi:hypothetical protein